MIRNLDSAGSKRAASLILPFSSFYSTKVNMTKKKSKSLQTKSAQDNMHKSISMNKHGDVLLRIWLKHSAKKSAILDLDDLEISIGVAAPPIDFQANNELLRYMRECLGTQEIDHIKGGISRHKVMVVYYTGVTIDEVRRKLLECLKA
uniref:Uncharacterized protein n=1 Tax=Ditylenchus dipsaci TaxID=166011 RepID=A0A915E0V0_9BILA